MMKNNRRFELLKDMPGAPVGTVFEYRPENLSYVQVIKRAADGLLRVPRVAMEIPFEVVEKNPEWFREIPERIEFKVDGPHMNRDGEWLFVLMGDRPRLFVDQVKKDMEVVLNGGFTDEQIRKVRQLYLRMITTTGTIDTGFTVYDKQEMYKIVNQFIEELKQNNKNK